MARLTKDKLSGSQQTLANRQKRASVGRARARAATDGQVARVLEYEQREARAYAASAQEPQARLSAWRAQLSRVQSEVRKARTSGDSRRAVLLAHRGRRIEGDLAREQHKLNSARRVATGAGLVRAKAGRVQGRMRAEELDRFLDAQAELRSSVRAHGAAPSERRDYAGLAGLAGLGQKEYEQLDPRSQRMARLEVDRELELRKELRATAGDLAAHVRDGPLKHRERVKAQRVFDSALEQRMREGGLNMPSVRAESWLESWRRDAQSDRRASGAAESSVMQDARAVASRRKRQLGRDRH